MKDDDDACSCCLGFEGVANPPNCKGLLKAGAESDVVVVEKIGAAVLFRGVKENAGSFDAVSDEANGFVKAGVDSAVFFSGDDLVGGEKEGAGTGSAGFSCSEAAAVYPMFL